MFSFLKNLFNKPPVQVEAPAPTAPVKVEAPEPVAQPAAKKPRKPRAKKPAAQ